MAAKKRQLLLMQTIGKLVFSLRNYRFLTGKTLFSHWDSLDDDLLALMDIDSFFRGRSCLFSAIKGVPDVSTPAIGLDEADARTAITEVLQLIKGREGATSLVVEE